MCLFGMMVHLIDLKKTFLAVENQILVGSNFSNVCLCLVVNDKHSAHVLVHFKNDEKHWHNHLAFCVRNWYYSE